MLSAFFSVYYLMGFIHGILFILAYIGTFAVIFFFMRLDVKLKVLKNHHNFYVTKVYIPVSGDILCLSLDL